MYKPTDCEITIIVKDGIIELKTTSPDINTGDIANVSALLLTSLIAQTNLSESRRLELLHPIIAGIAPSFYKRTMNQLTELFSETNEDTVH